jgi:hypothetical protein
MRQDMIVCSVSWPSWSWSVSSMCSKLSSFSCEISYDDVLERRLISESEGRPLQRANRDTIEGAPPGGLRAPIEAATGAALAALAWAMTVRGFEGLGPGDRAAWGQSDGVAGESWRHGRLAIVCRRPPAYQYYQK